ncbi:DNA polymerase delta subunit [Cyclospora cayetanensis]|uniref:DNA polymerase delta subunit n=1 Tax=Cyclospora cayetanensis TaxID=88456 RepID=A0A1D3D3W2_9EIME|nr:DNA polymerase delta subunit [Cyclospora cayetanensis]
MPRKEPSKAINTLSDDEVMKVGLPCNFSNLEMRTPRATRRSPSSEPRTPSKGPAAKTFSLGSPMVTPKLGRKKTKYRVTPPAASSVAPEPKPESAIPDSYRAPEVFASSGFPQRELEASAEAVRKGDPRLKWCSAEADEAEQLLRRFDMEAMYGPSVGLSREERWKRAARMGLNPPSEVMEILQMNSKNHMSVFDQRLNPKESNASR